VALREGARHFSHFRFVAGAAEAPSLTATNRGGERETRSGDPPERIGQPGRRRRWGDKMGSVDGQRGSRGCSHLRMSNTGLSCSLGQAGIEQDGVPYCRVDRPSARQLMAADWSAARTTKAREQPREAVGRLRS
jgi:hypothetical protein